MILISGCILESLQVLPTRTVLPTVAKTLIKNPQDFDYEDPYDSDVDPEIVIADTIVVSDDEMEVDDNNDDDDEDEESDEDLAENEVEQFVQLKEIEEKEEEEVEVAEEEESSDESTEENSDEPMEEQGAPIYNAEYIIKQRVVRGKVEYLVKWHGYR